MRKSPILFAIILLLFLVACTPPAPPPLPTSVILPTTAAVAELPDPNATAEETTIPLIPTVAGSPLPATWTPQPTANAVINDTIALGSTPSNTRTPRPATATPNLPTRTPIPPPATATSPATSTPQGAAIYQIPTLPPSDDLGPSKLGIHVIQNNDPRIMEFIRNAQPSIVKAVGDLGFLSEVKEVSPRTITIGRIDDIYAQNYIGDPVEAARDYVYKHLETYKLNPGVDYWEGWNEPTPKMQNMGWYAAYESERIRLLAQNGLKSAIGGFAVGVPEMHEFELFLPAIATAKEYGAILSLHEYGAPHMYNGVGSALPTYPMYPDRGSLTLRYRWYYEEFLIPQDLVIPLAITEAGIDGIIGNRPGPGGKGWHDFAGYWNEIGLGANATSAYIGQLAWYDTEVRQDGYVIGFTIFTAGDIEGWRSYEIDTILPDLSNYVISQY